MDKIKEYLKQDRQWPRHMRIAHAVYQARKAATKDDFIFWHAIYKANTDEKLDRA